MRASSTVFVKASSLVNLDLGGILTRFAGSEFRLGSTWFGNLGVLNQVGNGSRKAGRKKKKTLVKV